MRHAIENYELPEVVSSKGENYIVARSFLTDRELRALANMSNHRGLDIFHYLKIDAKYDGVVNSYIYARKTRVLSRDSLKQLITENMRFVPHRGKGRDKELQKVIDKKLNNALSKLEN